MTHHIKLNRAVRLAALDGYHTGPETRRAIINSWPEALIAQLNSMELARLYVLSLDTHTAGRQAERAAILAEGAVWTGERMAEVAA